MKSYKVGILGSGTVGQTLASGFARHGHDVILGSRTPAKLDEWQGKTGGKTGTFEQAAEHGEILVLAARASAAADVLRMIGERLKNKIILDATNPIAESAPEEGVLHYFTDLNHSLMEKLQEAFPEGQFVKCFSCVGAPFMIDPDFGAEKPTMFICGNSDPAKKITTELLEDFGWETADMGGARSARAIEPLAMLWCIPGLRQNSWSHAFRLLRK
jgi:predicted dinucleotide-binding enzyme